MGGEIKGAGSKPVQKKVVVETPPPARPVAATPVKTGLLERPSGFDVKMKRPVSITGRYPVGAVATALPVTTASATGPADVSALLEKGAAMKGIEPDGEFGQQKNIDAVKKGFAQTQTAIAGGKYGAALESLQKVLSSNEDAVNLMGSDVTKSTYTVAKQLEFLSEMETAGVKADYPPNEQQLVAYFKTLAKDPAGAREALDQYAQNFHVHPANVPGADTDVKYSADTKTNTAVPNDWSEVDSRSPGPNAKPESIGKQMNDCEGFAFIAEKLLTAADFKLENHLTVHDSPAGMHAMAMFTHPSEKGQHTLTSNDRVFHGSDAKAVAREGFAYAMPERQKIGPDKKPMFTSRDPKEYDSDNKEIRDPVMEPDVTGKEKFATGKTMEASQAGAANGGKTL